MSRMQGAEASCEGSGSNQICDTVRGSSPTRFTAAQMEKGGIHSSAGL